jgi:hypothetical protein
MPRKSVLSVLLENYSDKKIIPSLGSRIQYLILYKFQGNPSTRFYQTLDGLSKEFKIKRIQKGVLSVESVNVAHLVLSLIARYKGRYSMFFASEMNIREIFSEFKYINWSNTGLRT